MTGAPSISPLCRALLAGALMLCPVPWASAQPATPSTHVRPATHPELVLQTGHTEESIGAVALSPSGHTVASAGEYGEVRLWNAQTGELRRTLPLSSSRTLAFSASGQLVGAGNQLQFWSQHTGRLVRSMKVASGYSRALAVAPDGQTLALGTWDQGVDEQGLSLWSVKTGRVVHTLRGHRSWVTTIAFSPNGEILASGGADGAVKLWDMATKGLLRTLTARPPDTPQDTEKTRQSNDYKYHIYGLAFSPDGKMVASGDEGGAVRLWDVAGGRLKRRMGPLLPASQGERIQTLAFAPDGKTLLAALYGRSVRLWDPRTGQLKGHLKDTNTIYSFAFSRDGSTMVCGGHYPRLSLWDTRTWKLRRTFGPAAFTPLYLKLFALSPDHRFLAGKGYNQNMSLWDLQRGKLMALNGGGADGGVAFSGVLDGGTPPPGHRMLLSAGESLTLWNVETGQVARTVSVKSVMPASPRSASGNSARMVRFRENPNISVAAFSPSGKVLAGAAGERGAGEVFVWDVSAGLPSGKPKRILIGHKGQVESLAFSPDGKMLAAGGGEELPFDYGEGNHGVVTLWDMSGGKRIATLLGYEGVNAVAFSPDGTVLASGCGNEDGDRWGEVQLWDVKTKKLLRYLHGHGNYVETVAFARDGRTLASGSYGEIKLWNVGTGKLRRTIKVEGSMQLLAFSGDGQRLLSAARDATVRVWNTATGSLRVTFLVLPSAKEEAKQTPTVASNEWVAFTPAGYYVASPGAGKFIRWRIPGASSDQLFPAAKYKSTFHRPDLVRKALQGE